MIRTHARINEHIVIDWVLYQCTQQEYIMNHIAISVKISWANSEYIMTQGIITE